jgi:hypothetical protein
MPLAGSTVTITLADLDIVVGAGQAVAFEDINLFDVTISINGGTPEPFGVYRVTPVYNPTTGQHDYTFSHTVQLPEMLVVGDVVTLRYLSAGTEAGLFSTDITPLEITDESFEGVAENLLYDWLVPILGLWEEGRNHDQPLRTAGQPVMVWHMQQAPRPATPLLEGRISAIVKIGRDSIGAPDHNGYSKIVGTREYMLYLQYFGDRAIDNLIKIRDACEDPGRLGILYASGTTPVEASEPLDAHAFLGTMPEDRAMMDIRFRTTTKWVSRGETPVEEVVATGRIITGGITDTDDVELDVVAQQR